MDEKLTIFYNDEEMTVAFLISSAVIFVEEIVI
jgi:hypothetical protein